MIHLLTTRQVALLWGVSPRRVAILCEQGRIRSAEKIGGVWLIPPDANKPIDARTKARQELRESGGDEDDA